MPLVTCELHVPTIMSFVFCFCRLPDEDAGEVPAACVVINRDATESEEDIMNYVASNVASYKRVRSVHFMETIPKSPSGKIMRRILKEKITEKIKANVK